MVYYICVSFRESQPVLAENQRCGGLTAQHNAVSVTVSALFFYLSFIFSLNTYILTIETTSSVPTLSNIPTIKAQINFEKLDKSQMVWNLGT